MDDDPDFRYYDKSGKLPDQIHAEHFANAHFDEVKALLESISCPKTNKLVHQLMPNRLRRRAMSQNPKRLPIRFRQMHIAQMSKGGTPRKLKRPSRKYRRKPSNLMKEYARRMQKFTWLETHIWHAKRFHMKELWGYKIPFAPCDRAKRAAYRSVANHCLAQDVSFEGCIEVSGPEVELKAGLSRLCGTDCGLSINAKCYTTGRREGNVTLFTADSYPYKAIARVKFIWKPLSSDSNERTLWIWTHPLAYKNIVNELILIFSLSNVYCDGNGKVEAPCDPVVSDKDQKENLEAKKKEEKLNFITKNKKNIRIPEYKNGKIRVRELKDTINRFRLAGPLSHSVLQKAIQLAPSIDWLKDWSESNQETFIEHSKFWNETEAATSPAEFDAGIILSLNIVDPRSIREKKRKKAVPSLNPELIDSVPDLEELPHSAIWDQNLRDRVTENMMSTHDLNAKRNSEVWVLGVKGDFENELQPIPILLIQRAGYQSGLNSGWDIIIPSGYGIHLWYNLIQCGARAGGVQETDAIFHEIGVSQFHVDTVIEKIEATRKALELVVKYFQMPDNKRTNFTKLSIASPFSCPWHELIRDWHGSSDFYVVRNRESLVRLSNVCQRKFRSFETDPNQLIPVKLTALGHGNFEKFALICLPTRDDLKQNLRYIKNNNNNPPYVEPLKVDPNEKERKKSKFEHKKLLKRLRNRRIRIKKRRQKVSSDRVQISEPGTVTICQEQFNKMAKLWLPEAETIKNQCSRETIGYVTSGGFALSQGKMTAVGFVAAKGLEKLLSIVNKGKLMCLVRNTSSRDYRFAFLEIQTVE